MATQSRGSARAVGEALAVIGVILSLLMVAYQIRQTNGITRIQISQELASGFREINASLLETRELAGLVDRALQGASMADFVGAEQLQLTSFFVSTVRLWESLWLAAQEGIIDPARLDIVGGYGRIDTRYFREAWPFLRPAHDPKFVEFFEALAWNR